METSLTQLTSCPHDPASADKILLFIFWHYDYGFAKTIRLPFCSLSTCAPNCGSKECLDFLSFHFFCTLIIILPVVSNDNFVLKMQFELQFCRLT